MIRCENFSCFQEYQLWMFQLRINRIYIRACLMNLQILSLFPYNYIDRTLNLISKKKKDKVVRELISKTENV